MIATLNRDRLAGRGSSVKPQASSLLFLSCCLLLALASVPALAGPLGAEGDLYVALGYQSTARVDQYDGITGELVGTFAQDGLTEPLDLTFGPSGNLFVSDVSPDCVIEFDGQTGALIGTFASEGLSTPSGLTFGPSGNLFVASTNTSEILEYDGSTGDLVGAWGGEELLNPYRLTFGPTGNLFVSATYGDVLQYNGATGEFLGTFATVDRPRGLAFARNGNLLVADEETESVLEFDGSTGDLIRTFAAGLTYPSGGSVSGPDGSLYVGNVWAPCGVSQHYADTGSVVRTLATPAPWFKSLTFKPLSGPFPAPVVAGFDTGLEPPALPDNCNPHVATISGSGLEWGATVTLTRAGEPDVLGAITGVAPDGTALTVAFDLTGVATAGFWDCTVTYPDAQSDTLAGAVEIEQCPPPDVVFIAPAQVVNCGAFTGAYIDGGGFVSGASVHLSMAGQTDIVGTNVSASGGEIWADFDTYAAAAGFWDVVVTNPDGQQDVLPGGLEIALCGPPIPQRLWPVAIIAQRPDLPQSIQLDGQYFFPSDPPPTVTFHLDGWGDVAAPSSFNPERDDYIHVYSSVLDAAPVGVYDVIVTRSDGQAGTLADGFEIRSDPGVRSHVLGTWGGEVRTVFIDEAVDPYTAYVGSGRNLVVLDVTDPANVGELGRIDLGNLVLDVKVEAGYAYVGTFDVPNQFCTVNVSDPANMYVAWVSADNGGAPGQVELYENMAWVAWGGDMRVFNTTDPEDVYWGGPLFWGFVRAFAIVDDTLYIAGGPAFPPMFYVYDLSEDPISPTLLSSIELTWPPLWNRPTALVVEGDRVYVTTEDQVLAIIDVSDPNAPSEMGYFEGVWGVGPLAVADGLAYVADWTPSGWDGGTGTSDWEQSGGLQIIDVATDPANPTLVNTYQTHGAVTGVRVVGSRAYVMDEGEGLIILDLSVPDAPVRAGGWFSPAELRQVDKVGDLLYATDEWNGFAILDVSDPAIPSVVSAYQTATDGEHMNHWSIEVRDNVAYFAAGWGGLELVDVSDPANPSQIGGLSFGPALAARGMRLDGNVAHVGVQPSWGFGKFFNVDIDDPQQLHVLGAVDTGSPPLTIDSVRGIAHVADSSLGGPGSLAAVGTFDLSNPVVIREGLPQSTDLLYRDGLAYVADPRDQVGGLRILDVSDPTEPIEIGHYAAHGCTAVAFQAGLAYVIGNDLSDEAGHGQQALLVLDVSDPTSIALVAYEQLPGAIYDILVDGRHAYVTGGNDGPHAVIGLIILDVGLPGDADADLDLDLHDFAALQQCYGAGVAGSGVAFTADCLFADADQDDDVDADDFVGFATAMTGCDPPPADPTGACCLPDGTCTDGVTEPDCTWYCGGVYQGDGTTCDTVVCPPTGACCLPYGSVVCQDWTEAACLDHGGTYYGDGTDCSQGWCPFGACCDPLDASCTEKTPDACTATGGVYQGDGTDCATTTCPYGAYSNEIDPMTSVALAGTGLQLADDLTLEGTGARDLTYLDLRVYGNGGGAFDVTVELWTDCPGNGGTVIPGTTFNWTAVPDDGYVYTLTADLSSAPVTIPDTTWMVATFSTSQAGWIIAEQAEVGTTADAYARYNGTTWTCASTFTTHYAGLWANLRCVEGSSKSAGREAGQPALTVERIETPVDIKAVGNGRGIRQ